MKKYFSYAFAGAIALTGAVGFASCSTSGEDVVSNINQPDYNPSNTPEQDAVKTQFTISFPKNVATTRQSGTTVQNDPAIANFRGMNNIVLLPFAATGAAGVDPVGSSSTKLSDAISLTKIIVPSEQAVTNSIPAASLQAGSNSVLYNDVTIPVGTGSFLFYGKALDSGTDNFVNGSLLMTQGQPSAIKFDLVQTNSSSTVSSVGTALATYLSTIAQATNWDGCANTSNSGETWYDASLGPLYTKFISMKAGSSRTVQAAVQDLYTEIKDKSNTVSNAIKAAITNATYASAGAGDVLTFTAAIGNSEATYFPGDVNLPDGAALLNYEASTKTFTQKTDGNGNTGGVIAKYADYVYPASLYYYCNSGIKTSNSSQQSLYDGTNTWSQITGNSAFSGNSVETSTRSVAILDPIQYGVGRLDAKVQLEAATLYDKNGDTYTVPAGGFTVTGILIGGQKQVNFDFKQNTSATTEYTIFDNVTKSNGSLSATTTISATNYTLALETATDQAVKVAVELLNNGNAFEGADGIVPKGGKFYLIAELAPNSGIGYISGTMDQVFKQDYKTIVTFTIKTGLSKTDGSFNSTTGNTIGLGAAHNLIPDFRTPKLELGLSVDMTWQSGLEFGINL